MEIDRKELKSRAREAMGLTRPRFWTVALVYLLLTVGINDLLLLLPLPADSTDGFSSLPFFVTIFMLLYKVVVDFGLNLWSLWSNRRWNPGLGSLLQGFSIAGRVILMKLMILARVISWGLCLSFVAVLPLFLMDTLLLSFPWLLFIVIGLLYIAIWVMMLRYSLSSYLLADRPDDGAGAAVRRSAELMRGWTWELFKLEISFFGWVILSVLISGLVLVFSLWHSGFFQTLTAVGLEHLLDLTAGYSLWLSGLPLDLLSLSAEQISLFSQYAAVSDSLVTMLLTDLLCLPVLLWLIPYRSVTRAGFYEARLHLQKENIPPMPPL